MEEKVKSGDYQSASEVLREGLRLIEERELLKRLSASSLHELEAKLLESAEKLEQLRALENGIEMAVVKVDYDSIGVDAPEDVKRVEELLERLRG